MRRLARSERSVTPWRNGGGHTSEIAVAAGSSANAGFDWRLSVARIDGDGDFSAYPGVDRLLMPLSAGGLDLLVDGVRQSIPRFEAIPFAGEARVSAVDVTAPSLDLNVMVRREFGTASLGCEAVERTHLVSNRAGEVTAIIALDGALRVNGESLESEDAVLSGEAETIEVEGTGRIAIACVRPVSPDSD
ncbi:HutD family protein [Microbacterium sp. SD291]|uniref:HutD/Ves family protein n=1 Tax=Microbacterium sp. SD291 TaxID=2782007 RepID=UPI001A969BB5|nr:HutD family protein [Microbacterium sp. SD291]MBO0981320.1 HutD family protein [Microbacterium sp. SD291]